MLLFLHGFMGSARDWKETIELLLPDYTCLTLDLPGHGRTGRCLDPRAYTMEGSAQAVTEVMDERGIQRCTLIGYSMGGRLALSIAIHHPERCTELVMESASPGIQSAAERNERRALDEKRAQQLEHDDFETFLRSWYNQPLFQSLKREPDLFQQILDRRRENNPVELARSLRGTGPGVQPSLWHNLPRLETPLLVLAGGMDLKYKRIAQEMVALCPKARLALVPDTGHNVHAENTDEYTRALRRFLAKQD
ncbi:MAG: 2-succinyl-6-hydroxy-2,4-cyclohexadiene-1-carboxylate synthase [Candidatus Binatia bacterium]